MMNQKPYFFTKFKQPKGWMFVLNIKDFQLQIHIGLPYLIKIVII